MATLTITTTGAQDARIAPAFGAVLGLVDGNGDPINANAAEVKAHIIQYLRNIVLNYERKQAEAAITDTPIDPT